MRRTLRTTIVLAAALALLPATAHGRTLHVGDRGADVRTLNRTLAGLGFLPARHGDSTAFTTATAHGVVAFQKWHGLARDGVAGPQTRGRLRTAVRPTPQTAGRGRRIEVLLDRQVALLVRRGVVERTIAVSTGAEGYRTPAGAFRIHRKERRSWSHPYAVWLPYASYFHGGVAFHAWSDVPPYPASHGCVRIPEPFAKEVYDFARMGLPVRVLSFTTQLGAGTPGAGGDGPTGAERPAGPPGP